MTKACTAVFDTAKQEISCHHWCACTLYVCTSVENFLAAAQKNPVWNSLQ